MSSWLSSALRLRRPLVGIIPAAVWMATVLLPAMALDILPQAYAQEDGADPAEVFLKAFTSVNQADKMEADGRLKAALVKYRFAASLLDQLGKTNPNWQPLIVQYRVRKTTESIQKLEEKIRLQPSAESSYAGGPVVSSGPAPGARSYGSNPGLSDDDPLPAQDDDAGPAPRNMGYARGAASTDSMDRAALDLRDKLDKTTSDLNKALAQLKVAQQDKKQALQDKEATEFQLNVLRSKANQAQKKFEHAKADRDDLQAQIDQAEKRLKEAPGKNPQAATSRRELIVQISDLKKALAKAQADSDAAARIKEEQDKRLAASATPAPENATPAGGVAPEAAAKIASLEAANAILNQKLTLAETTIADLHAESARKKEELDGVRKELGTLREQLAASRDQNDRSATTITELRKQLDDNSAQLAQLKAKGITDEDSQRLAKENELLRGIVLRQLKDQARRDAARELLKNELARLDVQSKTLDQQVEVLGRPTVQLSDEERALFRETQVSITETSTMADGTMTANLTAIRARKPDGNAPSPPAETATPAAAETAATPAPVDAAAANASASPAAGGGGGPKVETATRPKVADASVPMALEAEADFNKGDYPEAEKTFDKLLAREPKNVWLLYNQGVVLFRQDKLKSAEVTLRKAVTIAPKDALSQSTLGIVYYKMRRYDEAIAALTQAIQLDPKNATAHNYLGITSSQKGWPEAAIDEIQKAIALNPNYADAHFNIAVIYATNQPPAKDRAEEHYKIATALGASPDPALEKLIRN